VTKARRAAVRKQRGALIVALMAGIAIMIILSTVAVQTWSDVLRRDNEAEMMFRAQDIVRALRRFQADKGRLPTELKELMEPGQRAQYFLRRLWKDPLVKGGQWQFVYASPAGGLLDPNVPTAPPAAGGPLQTGQVSTGLNKDDPGAFPPIGKKGDGSTEPTGLPIAGVKTRCSDPSFRRYKDKTEYSEWVFSIFDVDPRASTLKPPNQQTQTNP
jgi:type II secretory pathway pseudopilin PulG